MKRAITLLLALATLAGCGAAGAPMRPSANIGLSIGTDGVRPSARVGATNGAVSVAVGT